MRDTCTSSSEGTRRLESCIAAASCTAAARCAAAIAVARCASAASAAALFSSAAAAAAAARSMTRLAAAPVSARRVGGEVASRSTAGARSEESELDRWRSGTSTRCTPTCGKPAVRPGVTVGPRSTQSGSPAGRPAGRARSRRCSALVGLQRQKVGATLCSSCALQSAQGRGDAGPKATVAVTSTRRWCSCRAGSGGRALMRVALAAAEAPLAAAVRGCQRLHACALGWHDQPTARRS